jgi:hypothetical protein
VARPPGIDRRDVPFISPPTLTLPADGRKLIFLDLNHWISFAKALSGHRDGVQHKDVFDECMNAVDRGAAVFPISDALLLEVSRIGRHRQRRHIREAIEPLSRFLVVTSRLDISTHERETMLDLAVGPNPRPINTTSYLDWGVARALGRVGGFRVMSEDGLDVTAKARLAHAGGPEAFDAIMAEAELELQRHSLDGPTAGQEPEMRRQGWDPRSTDAIDRRRVEQEIEFVRALDANPELRRSQLRDAVGAREVIIELNEKLFRGLEERGASLADVTPPGGGMLVFDAMPSFDVAVTIKAAYHQNPSHRWTTNDIHDIDLLGSTIPYCDVVVTDKAAASHANRTGLAERHNTVVLPRLSDLRAHL